MKNSKVSVITTTYSIFNIDEILRNIKEQSYENIEVIIVDTKNILTGKKDFFFNDNIFVNIFKPENNLGYYESLKFGLMQATGEYIVFNTLNSLLLYNDFFSDAIDLFKTDKNIDIIFGKTKISSNLGFKVKEYCFKDLYNPEEFITEWENLRMIFSDYFDLNGFVFKKRLLFKAEAFSSEYTNAISIDASTLIKAVIISNKIASLKNFVIEKTITKLNKRDFDTTDLTELVINHFAISFDIKKFLQKRENRFNIKRFLNKYADYAFNSIYFDYFLNFGNEIFSLLLKSQNFRNKTVYIYGKGWIGLDLEIFLNSNNIKVESFIDDFRSGENIMDFNEFQKNYKKNSIVIIASYKYKDTLKIYKKLATLKEIEISDLFLKDIQ